MTILAVDPHQPVCSSCALACGHIPMHPVGWTDMAVCTLCGETKPCAPGEDYRPGSPEAITQAIRERMGASVVQVEEPAPEPTSGQQSVSEETR